MQRRSIRLRRPSWRRSVPAGTVASAVYLLAQGLDRRLLANDYDDLILWGGFISRHRTRQRVMGSIIHFALGIALAAAYDTVIRVIPVKSPLWRGVLFVQVENAVLYPGVPLLNAIHPSVRAGELPSLLTWRYFAVELLRHAAFGAVLGRTIDEDLD